MSTAAVKFNARVTESLFPIWRQLTANSRRKLYVPSNETDEVVPKGLHFGQRKLLLSEMEYLSWILMTSSSQVSDEPRQTSTASSSVGVGCDGLTPEGHSLLIVYAGAACGSHLPILLSLFPTVKFILIDPNRFCDEVLVISRNEHSQILQIIHGYCTIEVCEKIRIQYPPDKYDIHLISDIRSGNPPDLTNWENTQLIQRDNTMQAEWCFTLQAISVMLKFHPPYPSKDPSVDPTPESIKYFSGCCLWGIWSPRSSSEVRLVVLGPFNDVKRCTEKEYNCKEFEEQCCYYNSSNRYDADVKSERTVLDIYVTHVMKRTDDREAAILELSNQISVRLGTALFTPLDPTFSQNDARLFTFLHKGIKVNIKELFKRFRPSVTFDTVVKWAACRDVGKHDDAPNGFWSIANRRNIMDAYGVKLNTKRQR